MVQVINRNKEINSSTITCGDTGYQQYIPLSVLFYHKNVIKSVINASDPSITSGKRKKIVMFHQNTHTQRQ